MKREYNNANLPQVMLSLFKRFTQQQREALEVAAKDGFVRLNTREMQMFEQPFEDGGEDVHYLCTFTFQGSRLKRNIIVKPLEKCEND